MPHKSSAATRHNFRAPHENGKVRELPSPLLIWSQVFPGLELPLQAIRYCYKVASLPSEVLYEVLTQPSHDKDEAIAWDYDEKTGVLHTENIRIAKILKRRGFTVAITAFTVGLVYSEVMSELQKSSYAAFTRFVKLVDKQITFQFRSVTILEALKAVEKSKDIPHNQEKTSVTVKDGVVSCAGFRTALELINITSQVPAITVKGPAFAL